MRATALVGKESRQTQVGLKPAAQHGMRISPAPIGKLAPFRFRGGSSPLPPDVLVDPELVPGDRLLEYLLLPAPSRAEPPPAALEA